MPPPLQRQMQELRASESKFHAIADYTYGVEMCHIPTGRLLWINSSAERVFGCSATECLAMPDFPRPLVVEESTELLHADSWRWPAAANTISNFAACAVMAANTGGDFVAPIHSAGGHSPRDRASVRDNDRLSRHSAVLSAADELQRTGAAATLPECGEQEKPVLSALLSAISIGILFVDKDNTIRLLQPGVSTSGRFQTDCSRSDATSTRC